MQKSVIGKRTEVVPKLRCYREAGIAGCGDPSWLDCLVARFARILAMTN
jgi:hypothetical protein